MSKRVALCLAVLLALSACRAKGCTKTAGPALNCVAHENDNPEATCADYATATCDNFLNGLRCTSFACVYKDREACVAVNKAQCLCQLSLRGTGQTVATVWAGIQTRQSDGAVGPRPVLDPSCQVAGKLAPGETCVSDVQCDNGYCWLENPMKPCGVCKHFVSEGKPCSPGERCDYRAELRCLSGTCETGKDLGKGCEQGYECAGDAFCASGVCAPTKAAGEPCREDEECGDLHLACQGGKCQKRDYVKEGETCTFDADCTPGLTCRAGECKRVLLGDRCHGSDFPCGPGQRCELDKPYTGEGICLENAPLDGKCDSTRPSEGCVLGLWCIDGKCGVPNDATCK